MEIDHPVCSTTGETESCAGPACVQSCARTLGPDARLIDLGEALARFRREARTGMCNTGRYRMRYFSWGEGPPLVFIHGLGDSSASFVQPMSRLAGSFRCIGYDQPCGRGDGAQVRRYRHAHLVEDLWALMDHLELPRAYLMGSSFGSTITLAAMHARPERIPRAILQGGLPCRTLRRAELWLARLGRYLPGSAARLPYREKVLRATSQGLFDVRTPDVWKYFLEVTGRTRLVAFAQTALMLQQTDLRPILPAIRQPVLLVCGDLDTIVPMIFADMLQEGLPHARRVVIESCGHTPSYTNPEVFAEVIRDFLTPPATS